MDTDIEKRAQYAAQLKNSGMCNCCQAVVTALADEMKMDNVTLMQLASGYAAGMGTMENTCGALIGAVMAAGVRTRGSGTVRAARQISDSFKQKSGSVICRELKGTGTGRVLCPCDECVRNAVRAYCEAFGME